MSFAKQTITLGLCLAVAGCTTTTYSGRGDTWLSKSESLAEIKQMNAKGMMPIAIDCRFEDAAAEPPAYAVRIKWAPIPDNMKWRFDIGDSAYMREAAAKSAREKLKLVQRKQITDPTSGKKASCAFWRGP